MITYSQLDPQEQISALFVLNQNAEMFNEQNFDENVFSETVSILSRSFGNVYHKKMNGIQS